eukprot:Sspe_Gene.119128::Locus_114254_Transcript_2_2_Confidence_0.667_Length_749::g.119128::m.119128
MADAPPPSPRSGPCKGPKVEGEAIDTDTLLRMARLKVLLFRSANRQEYDKPDRTLLKSTECIIQRPKRHGSQVGFIRMLKEQRAADSPTSAAPVLMAPRAPCKPREPTMFFRIRTPVAIG